MEYITVSAKDLDDAITEALVELGVTSDQLDYEVIEKGSAGFLGIGMKQAVIRARRKPGAEPEEEPDLSELTHYGHKGKKDETGATDSQEPDQSAAEKPADQEGKYQDGKYQEGKKRSRSHNNRNRHNNHREYTDHEDYHDHTAADQSVQTEAVTDEAEETGAQPQEAAPVPKKEVVLAKVEDGTIEACVEFIKNVLDAMDMKDVNVMAEIDEEGALAINMEGSDMGIMIGKRGQTLDSLQYLANRVANKAQDGYVRVKLDTEDYRRRRKETLENLAHNIAGKVKRTRRKVELEPMNPYERRIIHSALQSDPYVTTHSEGEEPYRRVVVTYVRH